MRPRPADNPVVPVAGGTSPSDLFAAAAFCLGLTRGGPDFAVAGGAQSGCTAMLRSVIRAARDLQSGRMVASARFQVRVGGALAGTLTNNRP